nr:hypothetical protein [Tanacetum cinerariifolium]
MSMVVKTQDRKVTQISQSSGPTNLVADVTVYKEWEDRIERAAIIASSLEAEQDSGNINKTQCMATLNEPLPQGTGSGSGPWCQTTAKVKKVNDQEHIQDLVDKQKVIITKESIRCDLKFDDAEEKSEEARTKEKVKICRAEEIKQDIDLDVEIALVDEFQGRMQDADMFRVDDLEGNEVFVENSVEDSAALTTATTVDVDDELTLEKTLISIKANKPKVITTTITTPRAKGIVFHEQVQAHKPASLSKDKGKAKMIEPKKPLKKKDQITLDEEVARKLEAEMRAEMEEEEERIAREKDKENRYVIKEWDDVQATIDADRQAGQELDQESTKKQKMPEKEQDKVADDDIAELKRCLEIVPNDDVVEIKATLLSSKYPTTVDYKIYREGKKSYFKIIRAWKLTKLSNF